jgi:hypothetical protein
MDPGKRRADQDHAVILVSNKGGKLSSAWSRDELLPAQGPGCSTAAICQRRHNISCGCGPSRVCCHSQDRRRRGQTKARLPCAKSICGFLDCCKPCHGSIYLRSEQHLRQSLLQERDRVAELTRELATAQRGLETEVAQSSKATDEADRLRQAANTARTELEQERRRSAALARDLESAQRTIAARSTTEGPASNQPDPMKQGSPKELRRNRR